MTHSETQPRHPTLTDAQAELVPLLLDGQEPGAYVVIQCADLSSLMRQVWTSLERDRRQITEGRLTFRLMSRLMAGDFVVSTKQPPTSSEGARQ